MGWDTKEFLLEWIFLGFFWEWIFLGYGNGFLGMGMDFFRVFLGRFLLGVFFLFGEPAIIWGASQPRLSLMSPASVYSTNLFETLTRDVLVGCPCYAI